MPKRTGDLTAIGDLPLVKSLAKKVAAPTKAQLKLIEAAVAIRDQPDAAERAFMARQLVLCTLPHSDPGDSVEVWTRRTGNMVLGIQSGVDLDIGRKLGFPFGTIPRLLLFWITTEAVRMKARRLVLGRSLAEFMRQVGLDPGGGGKRSDHRRLKDQMRRLFKCHISFQATGADPSGAPGEAWRDMPVAPEGELWWHHHPEQTALWESWIELGEKFFEAVIASPVPVDLRALRALKRSPLALDLYALISYRAFVIVQKKLPAQFISWEQLRRQTGTDYADPDNFKKKAKAALRKIRAVYPGVTITSAKGGFALYATRLAVPQKNAAKLS